MATDPSKKQSLHALQATNFFLADVQTGLGPFLAAYLAGEGWEPGRVGLALTIGGIITVLLQTPAGATVDQLKSKRLILALASGVLAIGAILLSITAAPWAVYTSQVLIGGAGPFLAPTLAAVTMGIVGVTLFDRQFGKNQSFNSAGNVACALLIAGVSHLFGNRAIFITPLFSQFRRSSRFDSSRAVISTMIWREAEPSGSKAKRLLLGHRYPRHCWATESCWSFSSALSSST